MRAWPATPPPRLPGRGEPLRLYDTASETVHQVTAGPLARMYVCGITPYDATHLGHAATYLAFDMVQRVWRDAGYGVRYVQKDRKSTRLNSSHLKLSRMPSSA